MNSDHDQSGQRAGKFVWQKPTLTDLSIESTKGGTKTITFDIVIPPASVSYKSATAS